ncbi:amino acid racemase [bacterium]|nr:amino acid racemase [bacterium]
MKKLGVIGGMGSKATAYFYNLIVDYTEASSDQEHIEAIYLNHASMPDRTAAILSGNDQEVRELLIKDAVLLESLGASHIAIPCNTSHYFWREIQDSVNIPVINMIEEVINYVRSRNGGKIDKVGVLATDGTIKTKLYDEECERNSIEVVYPSEGHQKKVMDVIYSGVKSGKGVTGEELKEVVAELKLQGCDVVILGCTELSVLYKDVVDPYVVDALFVLAKKSIELSGKKFRSSR